MSSSQEALALDLVESAQCALTSTVGLVKLPSVFQAKSQLDIELSSMNHRQRSLSNTSGTTEPFTARQLEIQRAKEAASTEHAALLRGAGRRYENPAHQPIQGSTDAVTESDDLETRQVTNSSLSDQDSKAQKLPPKKRRRRAASRTSAPRRVAKKRASTKSGQYYHFLHLKDIRRREGKIQVCVVWAPTGTLLDDLRGAQAFKEARALMIKKFGKDEWDKEAAATKIQEAADTDWEFEYALE